LSLGQKEAFRNNNEEEKRKIESGIDVHDYV
jgi:hypothetical protein